MKLEDILALMKAMASHGIARLSYRSGDEEVKLQKAEGPVESRSHDHQEGEALLETTDWGDIVESPVVGTFYAQAAPDEPPFVQVGSQVEKGATLCIVEAMKLLNEIAAPISGVVTEIYATDGQKVEYGQVLMRIRPNEGDEA